MGGARSRSSPAAQVVAATATAAVLLASLLSARGVGGLEACNMDDKQLAACLPAIRRPFPPPAAACCAALRTADLPCLCRYKGAVLLWSIGLDPKLAAALPGKCNMMAPPECRNS